jgi:DNA polymerase-3 subunit alpha (Gram-positive type)
MYARGFEFLPMDLYQSDSRYFKIVDGKILPPFNSLPGMGDKAAEQLQIAASQGKFLSLDDIKDRGKVSQTILDTMVELGIINDLPQSNQLSIFDFT